MITPLSGAFRKVTLGVVALLILGVVAVYGFDLFSLRSQPIQDDATDFGEDEIMITNGVKHIVPLNKILSGGPGKDGIPSIDNPKFITVEETDRWLQEDDLVLGIYLNGVAKAYPHRIVVWHEIVNDFVGDTPVVVTYCPLCFTGAAFLRVLDGETVEFGVSGKLYNSDLVMYDRMTDTYWSQILGQAIVGELVDMKLERITLDTLKWSNWKSLHPDTLVLSQDTGHFRDYTRDPYAGYYDSNAVMFPVDSEDNRLHNKAIVYGVEFEGQAKAYPEVEIEKAGLVNDDLADHSLLVLWDSDKEVVAIFERRVGDTVLTFELRNGKLFDQQTGSEWSFEGEAISGMYTGTSLNRIISPPDFWFAWAAFNPGTELFLAP
ncbi:MAG: DUF3179 domain-containing protein [Candidatus Geothermarchaeales archaeon]